MRPKRWGRQWPHSSASTPPCGRGDRENLRGSGPDRRRGYAVVESCDGQEALQKIAEAPPDILLLDLDMPVLDGFGTIHKIRENPLSRSLPVLAVTAYAMQGDREKVLLSGFDGYLSKPINTSALDQELARLLNGNSHPTGPVDHADPARAGD